VEAEKALNEAGEKTISELPREVFEAADHRFTLALKRVDELAAHLPNPPRSISDVVLRAQVAFCHADKRNGRLAALSNEKVGDDEFVNARLIEAVLQFAGVNHY
jgi:hypothetical protein